MSSYQCRDVVVTVFLLVNLVMPVSARSAEAFVVDAGPDQVIDRAQLARLHGSVTLNESSPGALNVYWQKLSGPGEVIFDSADAAATAARFFHAGDYVLRLSASDGSRTSGDDVVIHVQQGQVLVYEVKISAGNDDAEEDHRGEVTLTGSNLDLGNNQWIGLRFSNVAINRGTVITGAHLQFQADEVSVEPTSLFIRGQREGDMSSFRAGPTDFSRRAMTKAAVAWSPAPWPVVGARGAGQRSPDIGAIIQEIVASEDWRFGQPIVIFVNGTGRRTAESFEGLAGRAPLLHIEYTSP